MGTSVMRAWLLYGASALMLTTAGAAFAGTPEDYQDFEAMEYVPFAASDALGGGPTAAPQLGGFAQQAQAHVAVSFQGISQYDVASVARNFIPPDTMGAVGTTQYMSFVNGGVAVFDKATGNRLSFVSDLAFWQGLGRAGANGDSRVMFNAAAGRWIALSFANNTAQLQIAVSDTANALGTWKSTIFTGYAGLGFGAVADYPTLALTSNSVIIGTNDFAPSSSGGPNNFRGTGLTVIPLNSLFSATPTVAGGVQFFTACCGAADDFTRGFAIQGVNGSGAGGVDHILAVSIEGNALTRYDISGVNANSSLGAVRGASTDFLGGTYASNGPGRQPNQVPDANPNASFANNDRVIDTLDDRVGSSVYEVNGLIYSVHTVTPLDNHGNSTEHTAVRWDVIRASDNVVLAEGDIKDATHDYYQGSLAVNAAGRVVIAYNRSGSDAADGKISFLARSFRTRADGSLGQLGDEILLQTSLVDDYHNGSVFGQVAAGRQRWGDYSAVSLDPNDPNSFWVIGEYAREYNNADSGHPGGTGGSRWSTWVADIVVGGAVPEPSNWAMLIAGFGLVGAAMRRRTGRPVAA